jgi:hypothetical protein
VPPKSKKLRHYRPWAMSISEKPDLFYLMKSLILSEVFNPDFGTSGRLWSKPK